MVVWVWVMMGEWTSICQPTILVWTATLNRPMPVAKRGILATPIKGTGHKGTFATPCETFSEPILMVRAAKLDWLLQLWPFSGHFGDVKWRVWGWKIHGEMAFSLPSGQDLPKQLWTATCHICRPPAAASWGKSKSNCFGFPRPLFF